MCHEGGILPVVTRSKSERKQTVFGANLKRLRDRAGMSQVRLADLAGVGRATIVRIERGDVGGPNPATAEALAGALGVPTAEFWSQVTVSLPLIEPAIASFVRSPWASVLRPALTELDLEGLRKLSGSVWINVLPTDEALYYLVLAHRAMPHQK